MLYDVDITSYESLQHCGIISEISFRGEFYCSKHIGIIGILYLNRSQTQYKSPQFSQFQLVCCFQLWLTRWKGGIERVIARG